MRALTRKEIIQTVDTWTVNNIPAGQATFAEVKLHLLGFPHRYTEPQLDYFVCWCHDDEAKAEMLRLVHSFHHDSGGGLIRIVGQYLRDTYGQESDDWFAAAAGTATAEDVFASHSGQLMSLGIGSAEDLKVFHPSLLFYAAEMFSSGKVYSPAVDASNATQRWAYASALLGGLPTLDWAVQPGAGETFWPFLARVGAPILVWIGQNQKKAAIVLLVLVVILFMVWWFKSKKKE